MQPSSRSVPDAGAGCALTARDHLRIADKFNEMYSHLVKSVDPS